ncbi:hypothetical protein [Streptomyces violaceorubidus]|uniref:Beta/gamma crystallin 'Greek key' domain-containing protein n=1 Tax=Streptomyces violaceorubidus TaxID=284042 RepID=A0ABV1T7C2_9ACTN
MLSAMLRRSKSGTKRSGIIIAAATLASAAVLVSGGTASASAQGSLSGLTACKNNYFNDCRGFLDAIDDLGNAESGMQDSISSIKNYTGHRVCFYMDNKYRGDYLWLDSGNEIPNLLATQYSRFNDNISSIKAC